MEETKKCKSRTPYIEGKEIKSKDCLGDLIDCTTVGGVQCWYCISCKKFTYFVGDEEHVSIFKP